MQTQQFREAQTRLRGEGLFAVSDLKGVATVLLEVSVFSAIAVGLHLTATWGWAYWLALELLGGLSLFRWFVILHECGHHTLFRAPAANTAVGHLASVFCLIPYHPWRNVHLLHHRWVGVVDKDPTQRDLLKLQQAPPLQNALFRVIWKLWLPIPFIQFLFKVFWGYPLERYRAGDPQKARKGLLSVSVCVGGQAAVVGALGFSAWATYFLPMLVVFYVVIENMNLPQHSELFPYLSDTHPRPVPLAEQDAITRSTHLPDWLGVVLALNFNRHTEHHLFPAAPWYSLNRVRRRLGDLGYAPPHQVPFVGFMRRLRRQDPLVVYRDSLPSGSATSRPSHREDAR